MDKDVVEELISAIRETLADICDTDKYASNLIDELEAGLK